MAECLSVTGARLAAGDDNGGSSAAGNTQMVSLLDKFRALTKSDLTQKYKIVMNPPRNKQSLRQLAKK